MKQLKLSLVVLTLLCFTASEAQVGSYFSKFRPSKNWSVGLQISPSHLNGDADNSTIGLSGGAHIKYSISQSFGLKLNGDIGVLKGGRTDPKFSNNKKDGRYSVSTVTQDNATGGANNSGPSEDSYTFNNNFKDLNITAVYTLGNLSFIRPLRKLQMFTFFGVGAIWSDVTGTFEGENAEVDARAYYKQWGDTYFQAFDDNGNEVSQADFDANNDALANAETYYKGRNLTIPFGIGVKRSFGKWLDLGVEWRTHWTRSDALDGFNFPLPRNESSDFYTLVGLQASIKLGAKGQDDHYDWLNPMETVYADLDSMKEVTSKLKTLLEDADGDGVDDFTDKEADSECDKVWPNGKVMDSDGDGVNDCKDLQPFSISTEVDENGVALDTDGDGVPNSIDEEPNTAADALVNVRGQAVDVGNACCDCEKVTLPTIMFDNSSSKISPSSYGVLYTIAEKMKSCPGLNVSAIGYTASKSGEQLAYKRVNSIVDHLEANYGIERSRINTGYASGSEVDYSTRRIDLSQSTK
jgi:outer membrane protein OmpA-like peptidoglycan-associated protein